MDLTVIAIFIMIWAFYLIVPTVLLSFLQWYLCGKNLRWGKILPILSAAASVLFTMVLLLAGIYAVGGGWGLILWGVPISLVLFNVPTLVFILVRRARKRRNAETDLNRMKIDDLE